MNSAVSKFKKLLTHLLRHLISTVDFRFAPHAGVCDSTSQSDFVLLILNPICCECSLAGLVSEVVHWVRHSAQFPIRCFQRASRTLLRSGTPTLLHRASKEPIFGLGMIEELGTSWLQGQSRHVLSPSALDGEEGLADNRRVYRATPEGQSLRCN